MLGIRPGELGEFLNGDPSAIVLVLKAALVNDIGGFLATLGDDELGAEVVSGRFQVRERELRETWRASRSDGAGSGVGSVRGVRLVVVVMSLLSFESRDGFFEGRRSATAHNSPELTQ